MDDSFAFRTTVPLRRQLDPRVLKAGAFFGMIVLGIGLFANWVISSERESFAKAERRESISEVAVTQIGMTEPMATDAEAKEAARLALVAARAAFTEHRSLLDAGPAQLTALQPGYTFVDGPSTMPRIVSVASTKGLWAAAIMGPEGTCYWIRMTSGGDVSRGTGSECTGTVALSAEDEGW